MDPSEPATVVIETDARGKHLRARGFRLTRRDAQSSELAPPVARIGSAPGNDVVLDDAAVSRIHCEIRVDADGYRMVDLGSTNGTFVDGMRARDVHLRTGAVLRLGQTELVFEPLDTTTELPLSTEDRFGELLGRAPAMRRLFAVLEKVARSDATVLIQGESGTGKELVAEAVHAASLRAAGPFAIFDCAAVAGSLIESELFGHERGAFTGASAARAGCLEDADGGTLFLDEVGEIPRELQAKLLRAIERREFRRVGSTQRRRADVRILAATHRDLAAAVNEGTFREDLYYRLAVVRVEVPPLRERLEDIPLLVEGFLRRMHARAPERAAATVANLSDETWRALRAHRWPGNVRELRNAVERAVALAGDALPSSIEPAASGSIPPPRISEEELGAYFVEQRADAIARFEADYVARALQRHGGNIARAAGEARMDRSYFRRLMKKHGIDGR